MLINSMRIYKVIFCPFSSGFFIVMLPIFPNYLLLYYAFQNFLISLSLFKCEVVARRSWSHSDTCCCVCKSYIKGEKFRTSSFYGATSKPARPQSSSWNYVRRSRTETGVDILCFFQYLLGFFNNCMEAYHIQADIILN